MAGPMTQIISRRARGARRRNGVSVLGHGVAQLPLVHVDTYNEELRDPDGFVGDRASNRAFQAILEDWRERVRRTGEDPLGDRIDLSKKKLDKILIEGSPEEAGVVQSAIEEFATELATVIRRFLQLKSWHGTDCIAIGGGLRKSRVGEIAIGRAAVLLKSSGGKVDLKPIRNHPDEAALVGCAFLAPAWVLKGHDAILGVDIGGSNIRAGLVDLKVKKAADLSKAAVAELELWCHAGEKVRPTRDQAVKRLAKMLKGLAHRADKAKLKLAPFVGIACPGLIREDGSIRKGTQNLPGNWESKSFNLPEALHELMPTIGRQDAVFILHNDAVVQGLSEAPFMCNVEHWGVLTIGTGLGNARFTSTCPRGRRKKAAAD